MASPTLIAKGGPVPPEESIYRALNPKHFEGALPGDGHFVMPRNHPPGEGVSTGIASLISVPELRSIEVIKQAYGDDFAVAELVVSDVLASVIALGISVIQQDAAEWGAFSGAHGVITGYQALTGNVGKQRIHDFQRHLVKLARRRFYAAGSDTATSSE
jgi:hypothetical protein